MKPRGPTRSVCLQNTTKFNTCSPAVNCSAHEIIKDGARQVVGEALDLSDWSNFFLVTIDEYGEGDGVKMIYLKTSANSKAESTLESLSFSEQIYVLAWQTLEHGSGEPELLVEAQLKDIHVDPFIKQRDALEIVNYLEVVFGCVTMLSHTVMRRISPHSQF